MKNREAIGYAVSSVAGAVLIGVCVYFTKSPYSALICCVTTLFGGRIGKSLSRQ